MVTTVPIGAGWGYAADRRRYFELLNAVEVAAGTDNRDRPGLAPRWDVGGHVVIRDDGERSGVHAAERNGSAPRETLTQDADRAPDFATRGLQFRKFSRTDVEAVEHAETVEATGVCVSIEYAICVLEQGDFPSCPVGVFKVVENQESTR
jgi:hypothetical protein